MQAHVTVDEHLLHSHMRISRVVARTPSEKYRFLFIGPSFCPFFPAQRINTIYTLLTQRMCTWECKLQKRENSQTLTWSRSNMKTKRNKTKRTMLGLFATPNPEKSQRKTEIEIIYALIIIFSNNFDKGSMECIIMQGLTRLCRRWLR